MNAEERTRLQRKHNGAADYVSIFLIARDGSRERTMRFFPVDVYRSMVEKLSIEKYQGDWCQDLKDEVNEDSRVSLVLDTNSCPPHPHPGSDSTIPRTPRWQDPIGRETANKIVKKLVPEWKAGLRPVQEDLVSAILDGDDLLCCTATGDGKSGAFSIPILVLNEYNTNRTLYPAGLPTRLNPVGIVVTPTKGLAANIVLELTRMKISAFAYSREPLGDARRRGVKLADEIKTCAKWQVICVDPEHLKTAEWREISESPIFRSKIIYAATDEVHLINEWGTNFRLDFKTIGLYQRGRLPISISILGLSATLAPGKDTAAVCHGLGLYDG
ncbi:P-loop containing nucleoside triphosphate hydrolase protein [Mycena galericulata]|nr:P-loop containing nucleoside triphosphate hydrolase protein [Mycena galericulata]